jgi:hypothetical protein
LYKAALHLKFYLILEFFSDGFSGPKLRGEKSDKENSDLHNNFAVDDGVGCSPGSRDQD